MGSAVRHRDLAVGDGWLIAYYPRVICAYFGPSVSDAEFERYAQQLDSDLEARPNSSRVGVLYYVPESTAMDSPRRRRVAKVLAKHKDKLARTTVAFAVATHSPFIRGVLSTLFWMAPPDYPHKVVAAPEEALAFFGEKIHGLDAKGTCRAFMSLLPGAQQMAG